MMDESYARGSTIVRNDSESFDSSAERFPGSGSLNSSNQTFLGGISSGSGVVKREDSLRRRGSSSSQRSSVSFPREMGDSILDSIRLSHEFVDQLVGTIDSSVIARVGDSGDRVTEVSLEENYESSKLNEDIGKEMEQYSPQIPDGGMTVSNGLPIQNASLSIPVQQLIDQTTPQIATNVTLDKMKDPMMLRKNSSNKDTSYKLPRNLDYLSYLVHLSFFGLVGVFTRYGLQKLFGPELLALTSDGTPLYLDLPSNILGSFLMGWFGIVFKADVRKVSEHLMVGVTTGYMGSLTTFSGWNQKMIVLSTNGHWVFAVAGIVLGMFIVNESIALGVASAEALRKFIMKPRECSEGGSGSSLDRWRMDSGRKHAAVATPLLVLLLILWISSVVLAAKTLQSLADTAVLWLGCVVAPPGVWARWYLARLNGEGLGKKKHLKWLPIGTLAANVLAACIMAALAVIIKAGASERASMILSGAELGFCGCLSTVSTFAAEVYTMRESGHGGRALAYATVSFVLAFSLATLIYSLPVWIKHYS